MKQKRQLYAALNENRRIVAQNLNAQTQNSARRQPVCIRRGVALLVGVLFLLNWVPVTPLWAAVPAEQTIFLPLIFNGNGTDPALFQLALVDETGAWLISSDGSRKILLTNDVQMNVVEDEIVIQVAPGGLYVAVQRSDGWAIYTNYGHLVADQIGVGCSLVWEQGGERVLLSKLGHGIERFAVADRQRTILLQTTDETNDHSPLWSASGDLLAFAHQEFGTTLYVTLIPNFDETQLPYQGENRDSGITNDKLVVLAQVESWHDQPMKFHWSNDQQTMIFAAKSTIHVRSLADDQHTTIQPAGFGLRETGRAIDLFDDRILYFADGGIYEVGLSGENPQRILAGDDLHYPQWGPNGERVLYRGTDDQLYMVNADGSNNHVIPNTASVSQFVILK